MRMVRHTLRVKQDPQCHVISEHIRDKLLVTFKCWSENQTEADYIFQIEFFSVYALELQRGMGRYIPSKPTDESCILEIQKSPWPPIIDEAFHESLFAKKKMKHYVVDSHDHQLSVACAGFNCRAIDRRDAKKYFEIWDMN